MRYLYIYLLLCATVMTHGCTSIYTDRVADVDPRGWRTDAPATITFLNGDTAAMYDMALLVRVDNTFSYGTLPVVIRTITPDSLRYEEKLILPLKPPAILKDDFYEAVIPYRSDVTLGRTGKYTFEISTRADGISGIWGIGISMKTK